MQAVKKFRGKEIQRWRTLKPQISLSQPQTSRHIPSIPNPFLPHKNPNTGCWLPPKYSLRRQADLVKKARVSNTLSLLPPGPKLSPSKFQHVFSAAGSQDTGVKGWTRSVEWTGVVKEKDKDTASRLYARKKMMFKGHKWERVRSARLRRRKILMRDMAKRVRRFKSLYHRRRPNPLKPARSAKAQKLPF